MTSFRRAILAGLPLLALLGLAACAANQISGTVLASYDAAVASEELALTSGKVTPAEATNLRELRVKAYNGVQAVVAAEKNGGTASASTANVANAAIAALLAEAQANGGK